MVTNINTNEQTVYSSEETAEEFNTTSTKVCNHIIKKSIMFDLYLVDYNQNVS